MAVRKLEGPRSRPAKAARREARLDPERDEALTSELALRGLSFSEWLRTKIDEDRERRQREARLAAVAEMAAMNVDLGLDPGDPDAADKLLRSLADEDASRYDDAFK